MGNKIKSPAFSFKGTGASMLKSFIVSLGAVVFSIVGLIALQRLFPQQDFSALTVVVITAASGFITNTIRVFVSEK